MTIEERLTIIEERNVRVETDKAWETSPFRVGTLCVITYLVAVVVMWAISVNQPAVNALIPTVGFFLSTQSLPIVKRWWTKRHTK